MSSLTHILAALSFLYSVNAQGSWPQPNPNSPVLVIQPNPNAPVVIQPNPNAPIVVHRDANGCQIYGTNWSQGAKCTVTGCYGYNTLVCDNITTAELSNNLDLYSKQKQFTDANLQPLYLIISDSSLTLSQDVFDTTSGSVISWIRRLDLVNTDIGANVDDAFNGLVNMTSLMLDNVPVERIGQATFDGLPALRNVYLHNLPKLRKIDAGFADPLIAVNVNCLTVDITTADSLTCDCRTVKHVQRFRKSLFAVGLLPQNKQATRTNSTCDINIICQYGPERINMKDVDTDVLCKVEAKGASEGPGNSGNLTAAINRQINTELSASYAYLSMATYFDRIDVNWKGFAKFFQKQSGEKREHADKLMKYHRKRGVRIVLADIKKPYRDEWGSGLEAMSDALQLEKNVNTALLEVHSFDSKQGDAQVCDFAETQYLGEQVRYIIKIAEYLTILSSKRTRSGSEDYQFEQET